MERNIKFFDRLYYVDMSQDGSCPISLHKYKLEEQDREEKKPMKKNLSDIIGEREYKKWFDGNKVVINAPTGTGKTTFVLTELLFCCKEKGKKCLILCNRRLLREQYGFDLAERYIRYAELCETVVVRTYQELAETLKKGMEVSHLFDGVDMIICDETHYFYADSDFNPWGTYVLLQNIIYAGYFKAMVFLTATLEETLPLIERVFS